VGHTTAEAKAPGTCGVLGRGACPATAKGCSRSIRITGVFCSTARGAGTVDDRGKGEGVVWTASGGGGCGEFCLDDFPNEMELDLETPSGRDDGRRFLTEGVVPRQRTTTLKATSTGVGRSSALATCFCNSASCSCCAMNCLPTSFNQG